MDSAAPRLSHRQVVVSFLALLLGMALAAIDQTIVATALPTIVGDLGGLDHLAWVVTAYLLTETVSTPLWGKLGDLYGRKRLFHGAILVFLVGSVLAGLATSMGQLIAFRGLQGVGAGGSSCWPRRSSPTSSARGSGDGTWGCSGRSSGPRA